MRFVRLFAMRWWVAAGVALVLVVAGLQGAGAQSASAAPGRAAAGAGVTAAVARPKTPAAVLAEDARPATPSGAAAGALAAARSSGSRAEVLADRTEFSQTFANPDGTMTYDASGSPLWVRQGDSWARPDASLARAADGSWSPAAATAGLTLSGGGGTTLATVTTGGDSLSVSWPSALPAPTISGATATYPGVLPGVNLAVTATTAGGFDETLVIEDQAAAADPQLAGLQLGVAASPGLTRTSMADGSAQWATAGGQPVFSSSAPLAWDSAPGSAGGSAAGGPGAGARVAAAPAAYSGGTVRLSVPRALLSGPASSFPVYVDPSYSVTSTVQVHGEGQSDSPNSFWWNTSTLGAGDTSADGIERSYYQMGIPGQLDGATVSSATLSETVVDAGSAASTAHTVGLYSTAALTAAPPSPTTWDNQPARYGGPSDASFTTTSATPNQAVTWNVAAWIQDTVNAGNSQWTAGLVNANESSTADWVAFSQSPTISVTYTAPVPLGTGPAPNATFLTFPISDRASLRVNVGSGDALFTTSDLTLPEASGSLTLGLDYNSLLVGTSAGTGSPGAGWGQRTGGDVRLYPSLGTSGSATFVGPDGTAATFAEPAPGSTAYGSPPEFPATLTTTVTGACPSGTAYQMTWHASGEIMCFYGSGLLASEADRDGNTTAYSYNGSGQDDLIAYTPEGASSPAETVTPSYSGSYLSGLSESGGAAGTKTVTYTDTSGEPSEVMQPDGDGLWLGYDASDDLTSIENWAGITTYLTYNSAHQVTSVVQYYNSSRAPATTRLSYVSPTQTQVATPDTNQGEPVASVPNTTYTINSEDLVTKAVDPAGDTRTDSYTPFNDVLTSTNQLGGTTTNTYGANNGESLTASQSPTGATASAAYGNSDTTADPTYQYLPSSSTDAQKNVTAYTYNGAGNLATAENNALAATASVTDNADGTPATSKDPDGGVTSYGYNSLHQVTTVTPPTSGSLKPQILTYDGFGRVATVTDGNGDTLTYTYDLADRVTKEAWTGGPKTLTVSYAYDGAGNLKTETSPAGTTSWTYDGRNQVLTVSSTSGGGTLTYAYDADGNMLTAADGAGTTSYTYNTLDQLTSMTDPTGVAWQFAYNKAGQRNIAYYNATTSSSPSSYGVEEQTGYDSAGRITSIDDTGSTGAATLSDNSYCYSPYVSGQACPTASASTDTELLRWSKNQQTGVVTTYAYDSGNRLKTVTPTSGASYSYAYDNDGDLTGGANAGTMTYNTSNQITGGPAYDNDGSMTWDPANGALGYNDAGQMTSASAAAGGGGAAAAETITYAGAGQDQPLSDGSATSITYGMADQYGQPRVDSYATAGTTVYILRDQQGDPLGLIAGGKSYIYLTDNSGSITGISGACGCSEAGYAYDPYGSPLSKSAGSGGSLVTQNLLGYTGNLTDAYTAGSTGYVHDGARWYNPHIGAFESQDTNSYLANPANGNRYAYAGDSPVNNIDPTGNSILDDITAGIIGASVSIFAFGATGNPLLALGLGGCAGGAAAEYFGGGDPASVAGGCMVGLAGAAAVSGIS